jgi:hypothetical protein
MVLSETPGLKLSWVMRGASGNRGDSVPKHTNRLTSEWILPRPERLKKNPTGHRQGGDFPKGGNGLSARDAQAACGFSCSASKCAPFFQTISVIAAIFRAKVRRAIEGLIPLVSKAW